jgi:hypothetical protein
MRRIPTTLAVVAGLIVIATTLALVPSPTPEARVVAMGIRSAVLLPATLDSRSNQNRRAIESVLDGAVSRLGSAAFAVRTQRLAVAASASIRSAAVWGTDYAVEVDWVAAEDRQHAVLAFVPASADQISFREEFIRTADESQAMVDTVATHIGEDLAVLLSDESRKEMALWGTNNPHAYQLAERATRSSGSRRLSR